MNKQIRFFLCLLIAGLLAGCASGPGYKEIESRITDLEPGNGRIYFYRPSAVGAAVQPSVRLNDDVVGKAKPKGFFYVDRPEGNYVVATSTEAKRSLSLVLDEGEEKYVKLEMRMGLFVGHVKPVLVDSAEGFADIQKLNYIGD